MRHYIPSFLFCFLLLTALFAPYGFSQTDLNIEKVTQSNTQFAIDLYKQIKTKEGNLFFSPYSISTAFALTYGGARGETAKQMADVLRLSLDNQELHSAFAELQAALNALQQNKNIQLRN